MSTRALPNEVNTPPNGWRYVVPETGKRIGPFAGWVQLRNQLAGHYKAAAYEMPADIKERVVAHICAEEPAYCGDPSAAPVVQSFAQATSHTYHAAVQCLRTLVSHRAGSGERPDQALQEKRAQICAACPENTDVQPCSVCGWSVLKGLIEKLAGSKTTSVDAKLKFCAVCHCSTKAKVATKHEAIWNHLPERQRKALPETCWLITEAAL